MILKRKTKDININKRTKNIIVRFFTAQNITRFSRARTRFLNVTRSPTYSLNAKVACYTHFPAICFDGICRFYPQLGEIAPKYVVLLLHGHFDNVLLDLVDISNCYFICNSSKRHFLLFYWCIVLFELKVVLLKGIDLGTCFLFIVLGFTSVLLGLVRNVVYSIGCYRVSIML
jgi:hypothetical protein